MRCRDGMASPVPLKVCRTVCVQLALGLPDLGGVSLNTTPQPLPKSQDMSPP